MKNNITSKIGKPITKMRNSFWLSVSDTNGVTAPHTISVNEAKIAITVSGFFINV